MEKIDFYRGVLVAKALDSDDKYDPTFYLEGIERHVIHNDQLFQAAEPGDSVIKNSGTYATILKKKDTTLVFYPEMDYGRHLYDDQ